MTLNLNQPNYFTTPRDVKWKHGQQAQILELLVLIGFDL
jgi:hypothetical protein